MVEPTSYQLAILLGLQRIKKPGEIYAGTVSFKEKSRRRAVGKRAKAARKVNR
jgi:hypothetical protein